ncbi:uncharacterized protein [Elaeis guineensis]|uniref:ERI1 exoribonuclease 2 n=1 Tax=Elaeis guineensis var. tenera TaxID=51953 RepID=A0A6I9R822_ELAGV|nr:ERI1 exoribonuclease 2 [Elaeis guineensis]
MINREDKETMQGNLEASSGCLRTKAFYYSSHESGNAFEGFPEHDNEMNINPSGTVESGNPSNRESSAPPNQAYNRPFYQQESYTWPSFHPDFQKFWHSPVNIVEAQFYPVNREYYFPVENRFHHLPFKMFAHGFPHGFQFQEFQYFVVIDFEATCDKEKNPHPQEIIEFPSVLVNSGTGQLEASFQTYVRPSYHQHLSDFCKELTGIQQIQVDRGVPLSEALLMHDKWLEDKGIKQKSFAIVTWSNWDCRVMLESECRFKRIRKPPYFNRWINLKVPFQEVFGGVRCNLKEAVQLAGLAWEGRAHCGLDDARNTARLLALLMRRGFRFSITNSLVWQSGDHPLPWQLPPDYPVDPAPQTQKLKDLVVPAFQFHPFMDPATGERCSYCFCGVRCSKSVVRKPGPMQGRCFFGCGRWTTTRRAVCNYFMWASP